MKATRIRGGLVWLTAVASLSPFGLNLVIPLDAALQSAYGYGPFAAAAVSGAYVLGLAIGQPLSGYASDRWGRRPTLLAGLAVAAVGGALSAMAATTTGLLIGRLLAGLGLSAALVVPRASLRDLSSGSSLVHGMAVLSAVFAFFPAITPVVGWWLFGWLGWQGTLATLPALVLIVASIAAVNHPETRPADTAAPRLAGLLVIWEHRTSRFVTLAFACIGGIFFVIVALAPPALRASIGADDGRVSTWLGGSCLAFLLGNAAVARAADPRGLLTLCRLGVALSALAAVSLLSTSVHASAGGWLAALLLYSLGHGLVFPSCVGLVMLAMPTRAGLAAAVIGMAPMLTGSMSAVVASVLPGSATLRLAAVVMVLTMAGAMALRSASQLPLPSPLLEHRPT